MAGLLDSHARSGPGERIGAGTAAVVLVEGVSDRIALETLAVRRGRDLAAEGVAIVPIGGAHAIGRFLEGLEPRGRNLALGGLCDAPEEQQFRRALERAGLGSNLTRTEMERLGFYVCDENLEEELIRALGTGAVQRVIATQGDLGAFRTYRKQPAHRDRSLHEQLSGFMWNRKIRYARLLVDALDLTRAPRPLDAVLAHV